MKLATDQEAAIVRNAERNGKGCDQVGSRRDSSVDKVSVGAPHVTEGFRVGSGRQR